MRAAATVALAAGASAALANLTPASAASLGQLNSQLGQQQARQQSLASSVSSLNGLISSLDGQIGAVQARESVVRVDLAREEAALESTRASLGRERKRVRILRKRLARARKLLSQQLVSGYENARPDLVGVVLNANGFNDLLEKLRFLHDAERQQKGIIVVTKRAKAQADAATRRLTALEASERGITTDTAAQVSAITGMESLLQSKQGALEQARSVQQEALAASRDQGAQLQSEISRVHAQQAAAERSATRTPPTPRSSTASPHASPRDPARRSSSGASQGSQGAPSHVASPAPVRAGGSSTGSWAIPSSIVQCESGGQNLPPNQAGASGYYQIIPSTWRQFGGNGSAAYLASKAEQSAVASRIYAGGSGVSAWDCAAMVGIH